jgi:hypothetical protein
MREISKEVLDESFSTTLTGISQQFEESSNSLYLRSTCSYSGLPGFSSPV